MSARLVVVSIVRYWEVALVAEKPPIAVVIVTGNRTTENIQPARRKVEMK